MFTSETETLFAGMGPRVQQQNQMGFGDNIFADDEDEQEEEGVPAQPGAPRPEFV